MQLWFAELASIRNVSWLLASNYPHCTPGKFQTVEVLWIPSQVALTLIEADHTIKCLCQLIQASRPPAQSICEIICESSSQH